MLRGRLNGRKGQDIMGGRIILTLLLTIATIGLGVVVIGIPLYHSVFGTDTIGVQQLAQRADFLVHGGTAAAFDATKQGTTYARTEYLFSPNKDVLLVGFGTGQKTVDGTSNALYDPSLVPYGIIQRPDSCGKQACVCQLTYKTHSRTTTRSGSGAGSTIEVTGTSCYPIKADTLGILRLDSTTAATADQHLEHMIIPVSKGDTQLLDIEYDPKRTPPTLLITPLPAKGGNFCWACPKQP